MTEARKFDIEKKNASITTDGARNAKEQVQISGADNEFLLDNQYDSSAEGAKTKETTVSNEDIICIVDIKKKIRNEDDEDDILEQNIISIFIITFMEIFDDRDPIFHQELPNISLISKMFDNNQNYRSHSSFETNTNIAVRATWNQIIWSPHALQLLVKNSGPGVYQMYLKKSRQAVKRFRK